MPSFLIWIAFVILLTISWPYLCGSTYGFCSIALNCVSNSPISHCLDYYTFILGLKIEYSTLVFINGKKRERKRETRDNSIRRCYNKVQKQDLNPCLSDSSARSKTIFLPGDYWSVPLAGPWMLFSR